MKAFAIILIVFMMLSVLGCAPLIIGGAAGALGAYAITKDTIQVETTKPYDSLWNAALMVAEIRGDVKVEDYTKGYIELRAHSSRAWINLLRLTAQTTRLKVSARKFHFPNITLAQDIFVKIMEQKE